MNNYWIREAESPQPPKYSKETQDKLDAITEISIQKGYDYHLHLRDEDYMESILPFSAREFLGGIIMPNLKPPVSTTVQAIQYYERIHAVCEFHGIEFHPLMTLYLTDNTTPDEIEAAQESGYIYGCKLYPAGATTNSADGVTDIKKIYPVLKVMEEVGMPLLVHGEVTWDTIDIFDREKEFINTILRPIAWNDFKDLKVVLEHITTEDAVNFVEMCDENIVATITAHHLFANRNHMLVGGIKPDYYCLPILKSERHRQTLVKAATSGSEKFFLGTDSAPHAINTKYASCGCAGSFTAPVAMALYTEIFEEVGNKQGNPLWPDVLEKFASTNGAKFYGLPMKEKTITLKKEEWIVPEFYSFGKRPAYVLEKSHLDYSDNAYRVTPFLSGRTMPWRVVG